MKGLLERATPGSGKSHAAASTIYGDLVESSIRADTDHVALMAGPTRVQVAQWAEQARRQGIGAVYEVYGRDQENCHQHAKCVRVSALGYEPMAVVCLRCPHNPEGVRSDKAAACGYIESLLAAVNGIGPREVFCCYESIETLSKRIAGAGATIGSIVFDEDPTRFFLLRHQIETRRLMMPMDSYRSLDEGQAQVLKAKLKPLLDVLRAMGDELQDGAQPDARAVCATLFRRMEQLAAGAGSRAGMHSAQVLVPLGEMFGEDVEQAVSALVVAVRKSGMVAGTYRLMGNAPPAWMPMLIRTLREEYERYRSGLEVWNHRLVMKLIDGNAILGFSVRRPLPRAERVVVLDATGNLERLGRLMPDVDWTEEVVDVRTPKIKTVHIRKSASRTVVNGNRKQALLDYVRLAVEQHVPAKAKMVVVTYGNADDQSFEEELQMIVRDARPDVEVEASHFGALRGSNRFETFDVVMTVGDNEPPPIGLLDEIAPLHHDDPEPLSLQQEAQAGHRRYKDPRVRVWAERYTVEELAQLACRHRPCSNPGRVYIHVGRLYPDRLLGRPTISVEGREMRAKVAQGSMWAFLERHGWLANVLLEAVGYLKTTVEPSHQREWSLRTLRELYGTEFQPLARPYSERQLRTLRRSLVGAFPAFRVGVDQTLGLGAQVAGQGSRNRFEQDWRLFVERHMKIVCDHALRESIAWHQESGMGIPRFTVNSISGKELSSRQ